MLKFGYVLITGKSLVLKFPEIRLMDLSLQLTPIQLNPLFHNTHTILVLTGFAQRPIVEVDDPTSGTLFWRRV